MKTIVPDIYKDFHCIADKCQHSCCVGWEIDVDADTYAKYQTLEGEFGERLHREIEMEECPHFRLTKEERCPFLNENNLCDIILHLGEDALCQICTDHPRFRNFWSDRVELGLGLCCEEAVRLTLQNPNPVKLIVLEEEDEEKPLEAFEQTLLLAREKAFAIIQDRSKPLEKRVEELLLAFQIQMPKKTPQQWAELFASLERLEPKWDEELTYLAQYEKTIQEPKLDAFEIPLEQVLFYFIYRHLSSAQDERELKAYLAFAVLSYEILSMILKSRAQKGRADFATFAETVRLFSSEIEYSEENTETLCTLLWELN